MIFSMPPMDKKIPTAVDFTLMVYQSYDRDHIRKR